MALMGGNKNGKADPKVDVKLNVKVNANKRNRSNAGGTETSSFADDPLDPMLIIKKRARRRLIGAIALVIGAIVFVPMIFDSGKNPVVDDISIQIPAKNTPFEPGKLAANHAAPAAPAADLNAAAAAVDVPEPGLSIVPPTTVPEAVKPAEKSTEKSATPPQESKPAEKKPAAEPTKDDTRAVALLEGKTEAVKEEKPASYAVQIGAFSDPEKVKFLREKLAAGGFKPYTEIVKTPQGERTRLRIGPYSDRPDADKAQERVKKLFVLDGTVVPLGQFAGSATGQ